MPADQFTKRLMYMEARAYAASQKTDPWAYARAATHIKNGIAGPGDYTATLENEEGGPRYHSVKRV